LNSFNSFACSCECIGNCTFKAISGGSEFVALVKIIEYSDYLEDDISGYDGKMPFSMTVEVIKKYKGSESRKKIKIWGDNGALCRPYIGDFEIGSYYLIAPGILEENSELGNKNDYDFYSCWTDYLSVDYKNRMVYGEYSKWRKKISLDKFEQKMYK